MSSWQFLEWTGLATTFFSKLVCFEDCCTSSKHDQDEVIVENVACWGEAVSDVSLLARRVPDEQLSEAVAEEPSTPRCSVTAAHVLETPSTVCPAEEVAHDDLLEEDELLSDSGEDVAESSAIKAQTQDMECFPGMRNLISDFLDARDFTALRTASRVFAVRDLAEHLIAVIQPERPDMLADLRLYALRQIPPEPRHQCLHSLFTNLESFWMRSPSIMLAFVQTLQRHCREEGDVGREMRWVMCTFSGQALVSKRKDVRHAVVKNILCWLASSNVEDVKCACMCLSLCSSPRDLGRFHAECVAALAAAHGAQLSRIEFGQRAMAVHCPALLTAMLLGSPTESRRSEW
ncbi:unnamed protein product [Symbiodinium natans]|uniref:Uncharacterized protein n=1 Tax=Symbiodinium natans TaxID=878477 RepID=A0A812RS69_9DINO|nr:unnamed protein product [Symbiodinium natans]